jgi:hypothetical protein
VGFINRFKLPIASIGIVLLIGTFLAFRPDKLFVNDEVDESLADGFAVESPVDSSSASADGTGATFVEAETGTQTAADPIESETTTTTIPVAATTTAPVAAAPVAVTSGGFYGIDHSADGTAAVYEQDGRFVLRFEDDTDIQNGPDLYVWVLPDGDYDGGDPSDYLDLGKLKGNVGGQNYALPVGFDPDLPQTVLIWCLRFGVPFAAAPLG